jgi:hypothetical protein
MNGGVMNRRVLLVLSCAVALAIPTLGQGTAARNDPIAKLAAVFEGRWSIQITLPGNAKHEEGKDGRGIERFYRGPGKHSFVERYHSTGTEGEISGLGIYWWDDSGKAYQILWCDNGTAGGCTPMNGGGKWEGNDLVLRQHFEQNGKQAELKEVFSGFAQNSFTQTLFKREDGGEWKVAVMIKATRVKESAKDTTAGHPKN